MLLKKNTDETDSDVLISFSDLNYCSFSHQLYRVFVMMKKSENFNDDEYLDDEMKISKIMIAFRLVQNTAILVSIPGLISSISTL